VENYLPFLIPIVFVPVFAGMWCGVIWLISKLGWRKFVDDRVGEEQLPRDAQKLGWQTLFIGGMGLPINYRSCMGGWITPMGIFLRPEWPFRPFHPLILLRWADVQDVREVAVLVIRNQKMTFRSGLPAITFYGRLGKAVLAEWQRQSGQEGRRA